MDRISIIGLGYIGLPTATLLASRKKRVIGVDVSLHVVETINKGNVHIVEPELDMLVQAAVGAGYLHATTTPEPADAFLIAVPTPFRAAAEGAGNPFPLPDLSYIEAAARSVAPVLVPGNLVILESTSPVGTTEKLAAWLAQARPDLSFPQQAGEQSDIRIAHCPERVLPGRTVHELVANDRVIGGMTPRCSQAAVALYKLFVQGECILTDARTAELCKLAENSFRDVNIAFANELSMICDAQGINVQELIALANRHPRVNILQPGCGVGGHCIAVDPWFIVSSAPEQARLISTARRVNDTKPRWIIDKVEQGIAELQAQGLGRDVRIACFGLSYKPDIDDLRESPALRIAEHLARCHGDRLGVIEPNLENLPANLMQMGAKKIEAAAALAWADILLVLVNHAQFRYISIKPTPAQRLIDARGI